MRLTAAQIKTLSEISEGKAVTVNHTKGSDVIVVGREDKQHKLKITPAGDVLSGRADDPRG